MRQKNKTLLEIIDRLPPFVVYALARDGHGGRPALLKIVNASGMPQRTFFRIAKKLTWAGVKVAQIDGFAKACGVNLLSQIKDRDFMRHTLQSDRPFRHLSPHQLKTFDSLCQRWQSFKVSVASSRQNQSDSTLCLHR